MQGILWNGRVRGELQSAFQKPSVGWMSKAVFGVQAMAYRVSRDYARLKNGEENVSSIMSQSPRINPMCYYGPLTYYSFDLPYAQSEIKIPAIALLGGTRKGGSPTSFISS